MDGFWVCTIVCCGCQNLLRVLVMKFPEGVPIVHGSMRSMAELGCRVKLELQLHASDVVGDKLTCDMP